MALPFCVQCSNVANSVLYFPTIFLVTQCQKWGLVGTNFACQVFYAMTMISLRCVVIFRDHREDRSSRLLTAVNRDLLLSEDSDTFTIQQIQLVTIREQLTEMMGQLTGTLCS